MDRSVDALQERAFLIKILPHLAAGFTLAIDMLENRIAQAQGRIIPQSEIDAGLYQIAAWERLFRCFDAPCESLAQTGDMVPREYLAGLLERVRRAGVMMTPTPYVTEAGPPPTPAGRLIGRIDAEGDFVAATAPQVTEPAPQASDPPAQAEKPLAGTHGDIKPAAARASNPMKDIWNLRQDAVKALQEQQLAMQKMEAEIMRRMIDSGKKR